MGSEVGVEGLSEVLTLARGLEKEGIRLVDEE